MLDFASPWMLLLLPLVALYAVRALRRPTAAALRYSSLATLKKVVPSGSGRPLKLLILLRTVTLALLVLTLARPRAGERSTEIESEGIDIVIALDTSGSMQAIDVAPGSDRKKNRLENAKIVTHDFVKGRQTDRIGLVVFGEQAYTQCPLTLDYGVLLQFLERSTIGMAGEGTALGSAIGVATNRIKEAKGDSRVIVLVTDGRNTAGRIPPLEAARAAAAYGIKIYPIGIGSNEAYLPVDTILGRQLVPQPLDLDEQTMREIARLTGGQYFRAGDTEAFRDTLETIDKLERTEIKIEEHMDYTELYHYLLAPALLLLLAEVLLQQTRLRRLP